MVIRPNGHFLFSFSLHPAVILPAPAPGHPPCTALGQLLPRFQRPSQFPLDPVAACISCHLANPVQRPLSLPAAASQLFPCSALGQLFSLLLTGHSTCKHPAATRCSWPLLFPVPATVPVAIPPCTGSLRPVQLPLTLGHCYFPCQQPLLPSSSSGHPLLHSHRPYALLPFQRPTSANSSQRPFLRCCFFPAANFQFHLHLFQQPPAHTRPAATHSSSSCPAASPPAFLPAATHLQNQRPVPSPAFSSARPLPCTQLSVSPCTHQWPTHLLASSL